MWEAVSGKIRSDILQENATTVSEANSAVDFH
jgi:hypothetical protein